MTAIKFHPAVLDAHAQFGGDLESMQKCYDWYDQRGRISTLEAELEKVREALDRWRTNSRDIFDAMCAMRDSINEYIPMPSLESDLLRGPESSVFCSVVAETVIRALSQDKEARE